MDKIARKIQRLRERGEDEARRQMSALEYDGRLDPDEDPIVADEDIVDDPDGEDDPDVEDDDRLPSERFYHPRH